MATTQSFVNDPEVNGIVSHLKNTMQQRRDTGQYVSDVVDTEGNEYVDLVMEGGGVLGVALVGYTYAMEQAGIRFRSIAGASAGAINGLLLSSVQEGSVSKEKSTDILEAVANKNFFDFIDGSRLVKGLMRIVFGKRRISDRIFRILLRITFFVGILVLMGLLQGIFYKAVGWFEQLLGIYDNLDKWDHNLVNRDFINVCIAIFLTAVTMIVSIYLFFRGLLNGYGLNPGRTFTQWMRDLLNKEGITSISNLQTERKKSADATFLVRQERLNEDMALNDHEAVLERLTPRSVFISADVSMKRKVFFLGGTDNESDYWEESGNIHPAYAIRASMSIPFFFRPLKVDDISKDSFAVKGAKPNVVKAKENMDQVRFVDGGLLSNFPIDVFHNYEHIPLLPTFGVRLGLDDETPTVQKPVNAIGYFVQFCNDMFSTLRSLNDQTFLRKNSEYKFLVAYIDTGESNWLNFSMEDAEKLALFKAGVKAAAQFLVGLEAKKSEAITFISPKNASQLNKIDPKKATLNTGFDWENYKQLRRLKQRYFTQVQHTNTDDTTQKA